MNFETLDLFGSPFERVETYVYYDEPRTFAMRSTVIQDLYYIVNTVDEDEESGVLITLAVGISNDRFHAMRSGLIPFRTVFSEAAEGMMFRVDWSWSEEDERIATVTSTHAQDLPAMWLPSEKARLSLPTNTTERFEESNIVALSAAQNRTIFALEIEHESSSITSFPARSAGALQVAVDGAVTSLAKEYVGGTITDAVREMSVSVLDLQAASFVLVLAIDSPGLLEATEITSTVFENISTFVDSVASGQSDAVLAELKQHSQTTRNRFRDILRPLAAEGSGLAITSVLAHSGQARKSSASSDSVRAAVSFIENLKPEISYVNVRRGVLIGLVLRTRRFEIVDVGATGHVYKGEMTDDATQKADGLAVGNESFVTAQIRVETPLTNDDSDLSGIKYFLESIDSFDEEK